MVGTKSNPTSGLSWADEVEKEEEEEEARAQRLQQQKPNPFGSARPREVILEEKGIDWRKLDNKLHEPSNLSLKKAKQLKENIPAPIEPIRGKQLYPQRNINGCDRSGIRSVCRPLQSQNLDLSVPPLKYPPKNIIGPMKEIQWSNNPHRIEIGRPNFREFRVVVERDYMVGERGMQWSLNSKRLDFSFQSHINCNIDLHELDIERERENAIGQNRGAHYMRTPIIHGERNWDNMNSMYDRRIGPLTNHDMGWRSVDEEFDWEYIQDEHGRRNGVRDGLVGPSRGHHRLISPAIRDNVEWVNMEYGSESRRFNVREFVDPLTGEMGNGGRAEAHHNADIAGTGHGKKNMKRGMKSGANNSNYHQRRGR